LYRDNHLRRQGKACDCLVFWRLDGAFIASAIELKGGKVKAQEVLDQLAAGARFIDLLTRDEEEPQFHPVLAQNRMHPLQATILREEPIRFRGQERLVQIVRCKSKLERAFQ
jgi:hypothetical protein